MRTRITWILTPEQKKMKNEFFATKADTEIKWMMVDADKIRKLTWTKLIKKIEKKDYTLG